MPHDAFFAGAPGLPGLQQPQVPARPECRSGFDGFGSTTLKWAADGELTDLDLHAILARMSVHDPQAARVFSDDSPAD
jgi:hypothetical protein